MQQKGKSKKTVVAILFFGIVVAIIAVLKWNMTEKEEKKKADYEDKLQNATEEYKKKPAVTDEPYPDRKTIEYSSASAAGTGNDSFTIDNIKHLEDEKLLSKKQEQGVLNALQEYLNGNVFEGNISNITIMEETIYTYEDKFGMVLCLNNTMLDYVKVTIEGDKITCKDENYGEPIDLLEEDEREIQKQHQQMYPEYSLDLEYDMEDFPYSKEDMAELVQSYYADMDGNYYVNYKKYGVELQKYMQKEWDYFMYSYSTYKYNTDKLKEELSKGDKELCRKGTIKASVKGYMSLYATNIVARVELTMYYEKKKESKMVYVTLINDGENLLLLPEDRSVEEYWDYKYQY